MSSQKLTTPRLIEALAKYSFRGCKPRYNFFAMGQIEQFLSLL